MGREIRFVIGAYDKAALLPQVAAALRARTEQLSREKMPGLWSASDRLSGGKTPQKSGKGVLWLCVGVFLLVPGLMDPRELLLPLVAGAAAVLLGLGRMMQSGTDRRFVRSAEVLLKGKEQAAVPPYEVVFSDEHMRMPEAMGGEAVPYADFETVVETADAYLLVFGGRAMVLRRQDIAEGSGAQLMELLRERVKRCLRVE